MCSYDVVSLFTNVPLRETIDICATTLYHNKSITPPSLNETEFVKLMLMVTSGVEFSFGNVMYKQIDGVAMGSPLGPVLANIFVGFCEASISPSLWPSMYCRFVDDVYCHDEDEDVCGTFLLTLNSLHLALRFTSEAEQNGSLSFLDVQISRNINTKSLDTTIYRKPTFTGLYIPWGSYTPTKSKRHLVKALVYRAHRICSPHLLQDELDRLTSIFTNNGYPKEFLAKLINEKPVTDKPIQFGPDRCPVVLRLPWVGTGSARVEKDVRGIVCPSYPCVKLYVIFGTVRAFSVKKDVLPTLSKSNLIYFFQCRQCEDRYVGRTLQHLGARIRQHVPLSCVPLDARDCRPRRGRPPKCAVQSIGGSSSSREDVTACPSSSACVGHGPAENSIKDGARPTRKPPKLTKDLSASERVTRSQVKIRTDEDERTTTTEVTTTVNIRKRGRPRKLTSISDTGQVGVRSSIEIRNGGDVTERTPGIAHPTVSVKKRGRPRKREETDSGDATKRRDDGTLEETTPNGAKNRTSSIKQHLSARANCRELYSDNVFSILSRGRCALHLAVLEALYIRKLDPELCVQKENVLSLQLFGVTPRRGGNNVT